MQALIVTGQGLVHAKPKVIAHPTLKHEAISAKLLNRIYAMQFKTWSDGTPVRVYVLPSKDPLHREFVISYFGMQAYQFDRLWNRLLFSGTGRGPVRVESEAEMIDKINSTQGAMGYISDTLPVTDVYVHTIEGTYE